ncbi:MAG: formate/nitrite transporter family protein [Fusobacteriaceae bacterium]
MSVLNLNQATEYTIATGVEKTKYPVLKAILLGIMGGIFIGFVCLGNLTAKSLLGPWGYFIGAMLFPVGFMFVILVGGSLFTGNCLVGLAYFRKETTFIEFIKDLVLVWIGNFIGSVFIAFLMVHGNVFEGHEHLVEITLKNAAGRADIPFFAAVASGFLCNILVAGAVWKSYAIKDGAGKILACFFPIMLFAFLGFQHVVANMTYFSLAYFLDPNSYSLVGSIMGNFVPVTIGNFLSGGIFLPLVYANLHAISLKKAAK